MNQPQKIPKECSKKVENHDKVHPILLKFSEQHGTPLRSLQQLSSWDLSRHPSWQSQHSNGHPVEMRLVISSPQLDFQFDQCQNCAACRSLWCNSKQLSEATRHFRHFTSFYHMHAQYILLHVCVCMICKMFGVGIPGIQGSLRNSNWLHLGIHSVYTYTYVYEYNIYIIYLGYCFLEYIHERVINKYIQIYQMSQKSKCKKNWSTEQLVFLKVSMISDEIQQGSAPHPWPSVPSQVRRRPKRSSFRSGCCQPWWSRTTSDHETRNRNASLYHFARCWLVLNSWMDFCMSSIWF